MHSVDNRGWCIRNNCPFTKLPINFLIGPLDGAVTAFHVLLKEWCIYLGYSCGELACQFTVYDLQVHSIDNGGWCLIIAHLLNFHWILCGTQLAGAVISCVQERIMLPIRLLMWRKIMPIYRLQSPSAFYRQSRKIFYNCTFTLPPLLPWILW